MFTGGSIRVPSAFNFLYGIRPSHGRMPYAKMANSMEGQETVHSVVGPIAHSVPGMMNCLVHDAPVQTADRRRLETLRYIRPSTRTLEI